MQIKLHSLICKCCKNYAPDSEALDEVIALLNRENSSANSLSTKEKDDLKAALKNLE